MVLFINKSPHTVLSKNRNCGCSACNFIPFLIQKPPPKPQKPPTSTQYNLIKLLLIFHDVLNVLNDRSWVMEKFQLLNGQRQGFRCFFTAYVYLDNFAF